MAAPTERRLGESTAQSIPLAVLAPPLLGSCPASFVGDKTHMTTLALVIAVAVFATGLALTAYKAFAVHRQAATLAGYFLGNRTLGPKLTHHNFWATSFALANGLAYFSTLGYKYGLSAMLFQIPWFLSFLVLAWQVRRIVKISANKTLHKFLGDSFGPWARVLSACLTLLAVLSTILYEVHLSSQIVLETVRREPVQLGPDFYVFLVIASVLCIWYVDAGGFLGTARTDTLQNYSGLAATCAVLIGLAAHAVNTLGPGSLWTAMQGAAAGSAQFGYEAIPLLVVTGILFYASVWNIVDPSNWQAWSANSDLQDEQTLQRLATETRRSAAKMLVFPCASGVFIGVIARAAGVGANEYSHFAAAISVAAHQWATVFGALPDGWSGYPVALGLLAGLLCFGLFSLALSTIDSYLISASQTYCWDLNTRTRSVVERIVEADAKKSTPEVLADGRQVVLTAKHFLYAAVIFCLILFEVMVRAVSKESDVFVVQFLIGSMLVSVAPPLVVAFARYARGYHGRAEPVVSWSAALALIAGLLATALTISSALVLGDDFNGYAWGPIAALGASASVMVAGVLASKLIHAGKGGSGDASK